MEPVKSSSSGSESVRITGVKHDDHNRAALRKVARACIALARDQLDLERRRRKPQKPRSAKGVRNA